MTREEAIEELLFMKHIFIAESDADKALNMAIEALEENESLAKSLNDAAELIHKLQKKNEWIPCSERLPETDRQVIVQTEHGLITDGRWTGDTWFTTDDYTCYGVVAWMPLPEPYKESEG